MNDLALIKFVSRERPTPEALADYGLLVLPDQLENEYPGCIRELIDAKPERPVLIYYSVLDCAPGWAGYPASSYMLRKGSLVDVRKAWLRKEGGPPGPRAGSRPEVIYWTGSQPNLYAIDLTRTDLVARLAQVIAERHTTLTRTVGRALGLFLDNPIMSPYHLLKERNGGAAPLVDGKDDEDMFNARWNRGLNFLLAGIRAYFPNAIILGNGARCEQLAQHLNGMWVQGFSKLDAKTIGRFTPPDRWVEPEMHVLDSNRGQDGIEYAAHAALVMGPKFMAGVIDVEHEAVMVPEVLSRELGDPADTESPVNGERWRLYASDLEHIHRVFVSEDGARWGCESATMREGE